MVQRTSEALNIQSGAAGQVQQSGTGFARPDVNAHSKGGTIQNFAQGGPDLLLNAIFGAGKAVFDEGVKQERTEAYLEGSALAGMGASADELDKNIFTRDWAGAGFRDTMGRLAQADANAKAQADMPKLAERPPEDLAEYLAERRVKLMPQMQGMSLEARKGMISTMLMDERAIIKQHGGEHYKFIVDTQKRAINAATDQHTRNLSASRIESPGNDAMAAYDASIDAAWASANSTLFLNPNLPTKERPGMIKEYAMAMLGSDHQRMYERMRDMTVTMPDGTQRTMLSELPQDDRAQLAGLYRSSLERTSGYRTFGFKMEMAQAKADWDDPNTPLSSYDQVNGKIQDGWKNGYYGDPGSKESVNAAASDLNDYLRAASKKQKSAGLATAFATGNIEAVHRMDATREDALDAWMGTTGKTMPLPAAVSALVTQGLQTGWREPLVRAGKMSAPAWAQLMVNKDIDPSNAKIVGDTLQTIVNAERAGKSGLVQHYIQEFDSETQDMILQTESNLRNGMPATEAIAKARAVILEGQKGGAITSALRSQHEKENAAAVMALEPMGHFKSGINFLQGMFSSSAANNGKLRARQGWFENPERVQEAQQTTRAATLEELNDVSRSNPMMDVSARTKKAEARVASRTVVTSWGPLVTPKGTTLESYFGVKDHDRLVTALDDMIKPVSPEGRISFSTGVNGELMYQERRNDGTFMGIKTMDPRMVKAKVEDMRKAESDKYNRLQGAGSVKEVVIDGAKFPITYNGRNGLNVDEEWMHELRGRLVKHEGITDTAKDDIGGSINPKTGRVVQTAGVGISDTNTFYPKGLAPGGKITPQQASDALRDSSEEAGKYALNWMTGTRTQGSKQAFQLFSELAFQGGGGNKSMNPLIVAMRDRNIPAAQAALRNTPAYKMSGDSARRKFYDASLLAALKE